MTTPRLLLGIEGDPLINGRAVTLLARRAHQTDRQHLRLSRPGIDHCNRARRAPGEVTAAIEARAGS